MKSLTSAQSLMAYRRDPTPSLILPSSGDFVGSVWGSGLFRGFRRFQEEQDVDLVINCLVQGDGEVLALEEEDGRMERTQKSLELCAAFLAAGKRVLVHCQHGIHRTGNFITLLLAMLLMMSSRSSTSSSSSSTSSSSSMMSSRSSTSWEIAFERAWGFWAARRGLEGRWNQRHDYYQESWTAFDEYYGQAPLDVIEAMYTAMAEAFMEACSTDQQAQKALRSIRRVLVPVELRPAQDRGGRDRSRSPRVSDVRDVPDAKARPKPSTAAKAMPKRPPPPPPPPAPASDVHDVPEVSWRAESVVEGEESQMPWRPFLKGDWRCTRCGNHNMHWRGYCFGQHGRCRNPRDANFRPGDWYCQCGNYNLYRRTHCNRGKCGRSRANGGEQLPPGL